MKRIQVAIFSAIAAASLAAAVVANQAVAITLPGDSLYQLQLVLKDHNGKAVLMPSLGGQVRIATMFYTQCGVACPLTIETIKQLREKLTSQEREQLQILMISLDPQRDSVPALKKTMEQRELDQRYWTLTRVEPGDLRRLAAALGVQYRQLKDMEINHSSILTLLDAQGRIRAKSSKIGEVDLEYLTAVKAVLAESKSSRGNAS
jgi:protein SCO1/2